MSLKSQVRDLIEQGKLDELTDLTCEEPKALRYVVAMTYRPEPELHAAACRGVAMASRHDPELVEQTVRRLVWAMNDESGTNALSAPGVILAIAKENPQLLIPMIPDLTRLSADEGLRDRLVEALELITEAYPGSAGRQIQQSLNKKFADQRKRRNKLKRRM